MTNREVLIRYRYLQSEVESIERTLDRIGTIGGPRPVRSPQLTGMPRGTNDPEAAIIQRSDYDDIMQALLDKTTELRGLMMRFELILDRVKDDRERIILRDYYANGMTDEWIAEHSFKPSLSQTTVNDIRNSALEKLDKIIIVSR